MLKFIDRWLEKILMKRLHKQRKKIIDDALIEFKYSHPDVTHQHLYNLQKQIEIESDRIYEIVDKSVLRAGIKRAKWTFWIMVVVTTILAGAIIGATHGTALPLIIPIASSIITWLVTIATISINYNERIIGGINAVVNAYEKTYRMAVEDKLLLDAEKINELNKRVSELTTKFNELLDNTKDVKSLRSKLDDHLNAIQDHNISDAKNNMDQSIFNMEEQNSTRNILINLNAKLEKLDAKVESMYSALEKNGILPAPTKIEKPLAKCASLFTVDTLDSSPQSDSKRVFMLCKSPHFLRGSPT